MHHSAVSSSTVDTESRARPLYAEVVFPLRLAQTFTYRLPVALREEARVGARLLVPFGRKMATAYVVELHDALDPAAELNEAEIKEARNCSTRSPC